MTSRTRSTSSATPFLLLAAVALAVFAWLGWHVYDQPGNPDEAALKATEMTRIVVEGAGGSNTSCPSLATAMAGDEGAAISRCNALTATVRQLGIPPASAQDLRVVESDLHRRSGTVTVAVTLASQGQEVPMRMGWKMKWVDGHWLGRRRRWGPPELTRAPSRHTTTRCGQAKSASPK